MLLTSFATISGVSHGSVESMVSLIDGSPGLLKISESYEFLVPIPLRIGHFPADPYVRLVSAIDLCLMLSRFDCLQ